MEVFVDEYEYPPAVEITRVPMEPDRPLTVWLLLRAQRHLPITLCSAMNSSLLAGGRMTSLFTRSQSSKSIQ